jgi:hypothetical protein
MSRTTFNATGHIAKLSPDFQPDTCRWIEGHGTEKAYTCAEPAIKGGSYCLEHHKRCHTKTPISDGSGKGNTIDKNLKFKW